MSRIDEIEKRAYEIWEQEGKPEGSHEEHWRQAEEELGGDGKTGSADPVLPTEKSGPKTGPTAL